jgi:hypothetical protein
MMDRLRAWLWHYRQGDFARAADKDLRVEQLRTKAISTRVRAEKVRDESRVIMRASFARADGRLRR